MTHEILQLSPLVMLLMLNAAKAAHSLQLHGLYMPDQKHCLQLKSVLQERIRLKSPE